MIDLRPLVLFLVCTTSVGQSSVETTNVKRFGTCAVANKIDMFTDQTTHQLVCREQNEGIGVPTELYVEVSDSGNFSIAVNVNESKPQRLPNTKHVTIRVDRGAVIEGDWTYSWSFVSGGWVIRHNDADLFTSLLTEIANGDRIALRVDRNIATIPLAQSRGAVEEFQVRIAHIQLIEQ